MTGFEVELAALPAAKAEVDRTHGSLQGALGDVTASVTSLIGSGWRGDAATAFREGFDTWHEGAEQVLKALATMSDLITVTEKEYSVTDTLSADQLDRLGGGL